MGVDQCIVFTLGGEARTTNQLLLLEEEEDSSSLYRSLSHEGLWSHGDACGDARGDAGSPPFSLHPGGHGHAPSDDQKPT